MSDNFSQVIFNDGEELTYQDLRDVQRFLQARLSDQFFGKLAPPFFESGFGDPEFPGEYGGPDGALATVKHRAFCLKPGRAFPFVGTNAAVTLATNAVGLAPGVLFQYLASEDLGTDASFVPFTFTGSDSWSIDAGDATNPRVDLLQMTLAWADGTPTSVAAMTSGVKASLDMSGITTHADTVYQAKVAGISGDNVSISYQKRTSGSGVTYSENGNAVLIQYEDAVSTNSDVEAQVIAHATIIEIKSTGTGATVLHDPADTTAYVHLAGGADELISTTSLNKRRQISCMLNVKKGTPAASPVYPTPDSGAAVVGAVVVGANYLTTTQIISGWDTAGANAVLHDQRIPLGLSVYRMSPKDLAFGGSDWALGGTQSNIQASGASKFLYARCPIGGHSSRLLAVAVNILPHTGVTAKLRVLGADARYIADLTSALITAVASGTQRFIIAPIDVIEAAGVFAAGPTVGPSTSGAKIGPPIWTSGQRAPYRPFATSADSGVDPISAQPYETILQLELVSAGSSDVVFGVTFYVAEGL